MKALKTIATATLMAATVFGSVTIADAMPLPVPTALTSGSANDVTNVAWKLVCKYNRCRRVWVRPRVIRPRVIIRPRVVRPRPAVRNLTRAHINWCLRRYRSYDPGTDMYLSFDGDYRYCNSPYR